MLCYEINVNEQIEFHTVLQKSLTETEVYVVDEWSSRIEAVNVEVLISIE